MQPKTRVVYDIETAQSVTRTGQAMIRSITEGIHPGAMNIFAAGRQTGKSTLTMKVLKNRYYGATGRTFWLDTDSVSQFWAYNTGNVMEQKNRSKYTFSRNWYTVNLPWSFPEQDERIKWCRDRFGADPKNPDAWSRWYPISLYIRFRDLKDYQWYQLTWGD